MKRILSYFSIALCLILSQLPTMANSIDPKGDSLAFAKMRQRMAEIRKVRPTVALVLSGGGAKGTAHVPAIQYIEELGIPVDLVVGTSMGGLIGGLYSLGYTVHEMDSIVRNMDWAWALSDKLSRDYITYTDMKYKEKYLLSIPFYYERDYFRMKVADENRFDNVKQHEILHIGADNEEGADFLKHNLLGSLPSGYLYGQNVNNMISSLTVGYQDSIDFQTLPIPYVCVAADMVTGKTKIWHSGRLNDAMRSTMSIPGVFAPVKTGGMVLVDGGIRDNFPTGLAKEMGADIIIGVDLAQGRKGYLDVNNIADIAAQTIEMLGRDTYERNITIPDVTINPHLPEYGSLSFSTEAVDTIMARGWQAAQAQDSLLRVIAARTKGKFISQNRPKAFDFQTDSLIIADVDITGVLPKEKELLKNRLNLKFGQKISRQDLEHIVAQIYGTQAYDYVTYELHGASEPYKLVLNCKKGPIHQLGIGVRADTEEIVSVLLNLGFNAHTLQGHKLDLVGKINANPYVQLHWSYDIPKVPTLNASTSFRWTDMNLLNFRDNTLNFNFYDAKQELYLSNIKWKRLDINVGLRNDFFNVRNLKSSQIMGDYDVSLLRNNFMSLFADGRTDTFDDGYFPTKGMSAGLSYSWTFAGFPNPVNRFHTFQADTKVVIPAGNIFAFIPSFNVRFLLGEDVPVPYFNAIGGSLAGRYVDQQIPFIGVTNLSAMKNVLTVFRTDYRFRLMKNHYVTAIVNYARDCDDFRSYVEGLGYFGAGLEYAYDTIFGPFKFNVHWSNLSKTVGVYLSAGYNF
jgi:NTE family protein